MEPHQWQSTIEEPRVLRVDVAGILHGTLRLKIHLRDGAIQVVDVPLADIDAAVRKQIKEGL